MKYNGEEVKEVLITFTDGHTARIKGVRNLSMEVCKDPEDNFCDLLTAKYDARDLQMRW